jgi:hypothetical protein
MVKGMRELGWTRKRIMRNICNHLDTHMNKRRIFGG